MAKSKPCSVCGQQKKLLHNGLKVRCSNGKYKALFLCDFCAARFAELLVCAYNDRCHELNADVKRNVEVMFNVDASWARFEQIKSVVDMYCRYGDPAEED